MYILNEQLAENIPKDLARQNMLTEISWMALSIFLVILLYLIGEYITSKLSMIFFLFHCIYFIYLSVCVKAKTLE